MMSMLTYTETAKMSENIWPVFFTMLLKITIEKVNQKVIEKCK